MTLPQQPHCCDWLQYWLHPVLDDGGHQDETRPIMQGVPGQSVRCTVAMLHVTDRLIYGLHFTSSGYQLFSKEMLVQLRDVKANERLQEIGRRWVALSDEEKQHWNRRKDAMWVQYRKDLAKFKKVRLFSCKSVNY